MLTKKELNNFTDEFLFFQESLIEIFINNNESSFRLFFGIENLEVYNSPQIYSPEQAMRYAKYQCLSDFVMRSELTCGLMIFFTDRILVQSDSAITLLGSATEPEPMPANFFYPNPCDRKDFRRNLQRHTITEQPGRLQNLDLQIYEGKSSGQLIWIDNEMVLTLEFFDAAAVCNIF